MSVVEEQAKELGVDAAGGAKDGGQERDTMIVSVGLLILIVFLLGGFAKRLVDVGRCAYTFLPATSPFAFPPSQPPSLPHIFSSCHHDHDRHALFPDLIGPLPIPHLRQVQLLELNGNSSKTDLGCEKRSGEPYVWCYQ